MGNVASYDRHRARRHDTINIAERFHASLRHNLNSLFDRRRHSASDSLFLDASPADMTDAT